MSTSPPIIDRHLPRNQKCGCRWEPRADCGEDGGIWHRCTGCNEFMFQSWEALWKSIDKAIQNTSGEDEVVIHISRIEGTTRVAIVQDSSTNMTLIEQNLDADPDESCSTEMFLYGHAKQTIAKALSEYQRHENDRR